jgi:hypothetical protein
MAGQTKTRAAKIGKSYQLLPVIGPSAGVDLRTSPTLIEPTRARTLVNFSLTEPGALVVRPGYRVFSTASLGVGRIQGAARVYLNTGIPAAVSTSFSLVAWDGKVYNLSDTGAWASTAGQLALSNTNAVSFVSDRDLVAVLDGSTSPWKSTNGSSWTHFGITSGAAPTVSTLSSGVVSSGDYEIAYTYKDRDLAFESNGSSGATVTLTGSTGALKVVVPNSTDPQVDAIVLYARDVTAGETILRKVSSAAPTSSGASSTYVISSTSWATNDEIPTDHDVAPVLSFGVVWKNRWWARSATVTNRLLFTQLFQPQSWPPLFYVDIPFERGDSIQALVPLGDSLIVFGNTKAFIILGQTSLDFEVRPSIGSEDGAYGFRAVAVIENGVVHMSASGIYIFDGTADKLLSFDLEPGLRDLVSNASAADLARIAMVYHQSQKELRIAVPRRYPSGGVGEWVLDLNRTRTTEQPAWTATDRDVAGYLYWDGPETQNGNRGRLFSFPSTSAQIFEESVGTSANSSNIMAEYEGPGLTLGAHRARWLDMRGEYEPHGGDLSAEVIIDGVSQGIQSINIGAGLSILGQEILGTSVLGGSGRRQFYMTLPLTSEGRTFVARFNYSGQETFRLFSYHPGLTPESASRSFTE